MSDNNGVVVTPVNIQYVGSVSGSGSSGLGAAAYLTSSIVASGSTVSIVANGITMFVADAGSTSNAGIISLTGSNFSDGASPFLRCGNVGGIIGYPQGLIVRDQTGNTNGNLIANYFYASGVNNTGSNDAFVANNGNAVIGNTFSYRFSNGSRISNAADGVLCLSNNSISSFSRLVLGLANASFPALARSGSAIKVRLGDDSGDASITTKSAYAGSGAPTLPAYSFLSDSGSGMYSPTFGALAFAINQTASLSLTSSINAAQPTWTQTHLIMGTGNTLGGRVVSNATLGNPAGGIAFKTWDASAYVATYGLSFIAQGGNVSVVNPTFNTSGFYFTQGSSGQAYTGLRLVSNGKMSAVGDETTAGNRIGWINQSKPVGSKATSYSVALADSFTVFDNSGATGTITYTLPVIGANAGQVYTFATAAPSAITIAPNAADSIVFVGLTKAAGASISSAAAKGQVVTLVATSANTWIATTALGSWS